MKSVSIDHTSLHSSSVVAENVYSLIKKEKHPPVIMCIGSDRITGDCLGPLVGHRLTSDLGVNAYVYGTLANPVTALNLQSTIDFVKLTHPRSKVIVVDASLGLGSDIGLIRVSRGCLLPGSGVNKTLPKVGDISITAVVNVLSEPRAALLQSTRLSLVFGLSGVIAKGLCDALKLYNTVKTLAS